MQQQPKTKQEYKAKLMATLQSKGLDDQMKKQLRMHILDQLKHPHKSKRTDIGTDLYKRVVVSLVSEYMLLNAYDYSNSVYLPETGCQGKCLTRSQLQSYFGVSARVDTALLEYFVGMYLPGSKQLLEMGCQTNQLEIGLNLEDRMGLIDRKFRNAPKDTADTMPELAVLRKELEIEFREQKERDMRRFREFELESVRLEQFEKAKRKYDDMRGKIEEGYRKKNEELRRKQRKILDGEESRRREFELMKSQFEDQMRKESELLELRRINVQEQSKLSMAQKNIERDKMDKLQQELQNKIREYDKLNVKAADTIKYEVNLAKLAIQKEHQDKEMQTLERKKAIDEDYYKMLSIKDSVQLIQRQNSRLVEENKQIRNHVNDLRQQLKQIQGEVKELQHRLQLSKEDKLSSEREAQQLSFKLEKEAQKVTKLMHQLTTARTNLDQAREQLQNYKGREMEEDMPILDVPVPTPDKTSSADELTRKLEQLRRKRRLQIEKLRLMGE